MSAPPPGGSSATEHTSAAEHAITGIDLQGIHKTYQMALERLHILRGVNLRLAPGEFVAIMGPSGSGKSTLMNIIGLLDVPTQGQYWLEGQNVSHLDRTASARRRNRHIGYVYQNFNLIPRVSVLGNVETPLMYQGCPPRERRARAMAVLERVGMTDRSSHLPSQLSGGQQQRVAVARALVCGAGVLLADEPTGNLDTRTGLQVMALFEELHSEGKTVILVTHDEEIARHASRRVMFRDGRIRTEVANPAPRRALEVMAALPAETEDWEAAVGQS